MQKNTNSPEIELKLLASWVLLVRENFLGEIVGTCSTVCVFSCILVEVFVGVWSKIFQQIRQKTAFDSSRETSFQNLVYFIQQKLILFFWTLGLNYSGSELKPVSSSLLTAFNVCERTLWLLFSIKTYGFLDFEWKIFGEVVKITLYSYTRSLLKGKFLKKKFLSSFFPDCKGKLFST